MSKTLKQFLVHHKVNKGSPFSHTSFGDPPNSFPGSYNITLEEYDNFIELYYNHVFIKKLPCYLTEKHQDGYGPILIDLDLRYKGILDDRNYTLDIIKSFITIYICELKKLIGVDNDKINAYILEKPNCKKDHNKNITKDGIHIMFPDIVVDPMVQYVARYNTIKNKECIQLFKSLKVSNSLSDIFDKCVIETNNWLLYGSSKPNSPRYILTNIFKYDKSGTLNKIDIKKCSDK